MAKRSDHPGDLLAQETTRPVALRLEEFLPYRLNYVAAEVSQALSGIYGKRFGISIPEWRVIATLGQFGSLAARDIGQHSRMHKTTVSRAVTTLEKRKLIARRANRDDLREAFLTLTEAGLLGRALPGADTGGAQPIRFAAHPPVGPAREFGASVLRRLSGQTDSQASG
jgi:DNA-binding transcriptional MocR family regulator